MTNSKIQNNRNNEINNNKNNPVDEYLQCLSYCDIHPKGIDNDCEVICIETVSYTHLTLPTTPYV